VRDLSEKEQGLPGTHSQYSVLELYDDDDDINLRPGKTSVFQTRKRVDSYEDKKILNTKNPVIRKESNTTVQGS
jgi:hypothetical protein